MYLKYIFNFFLKIINSLYLISMKNYNYFLNELNHLSCIVNYY